MESKAVNLTRCSRCGAEDWPEYMNASGSCALCCEKDAQAREAAERARGVAP